MIRFCDIEVYKVYKTQLTRDAVFDFYSSNHLNDILVIYGENDAFYGTLEREDLINNKDLESAICSERLFFNETIFDNARKIFERVRPRKLIPVFDYNGKLDCFCFNCQDYRYDQVIGYLKVLDSLEYKINFLEQMEPTSKMLCIHELNEISFHLYQVAKKHNINVKVAGIRWANLNIFDEFNFNCDENNVLHLYAENYMEVICDDVTFQKKVQNVGENFRLIIQSGIKLGQSALQKVIKELDSRIPICFCEIPVKMPYRTKWSEAFCKVKDVHNKIQRYAEFSGVDEENAVRDIYGITGYPLEQQLQESLVISIDSHFNGMSYLSNRSKHRIYIIGPCIIRGYCVPDYKTLSYNIQKRVESDDYEVIRVVMSKVDWILLEKLVMLPVREGDIILLVADDESSAGVEIPNNVCKLDLSVCYEEMGRDKPYFSDCPIHVNADGHKVLADYIYNNYLEKVISKCKFDNGIYIQRGEILNQKSRQRIEEYINHYKVINTTKENIGAIVMNCNPFTLGHQHLITTAAKMVDILYIFVVEENKSAFSFEDRIELVKSGTQEYDNVIVIPSGQFVLSYSTLPSYFEKETVNDINIDASNDIEIFARYIAPGFGITKRFVGEEPIDNITRQYNEQMSKILPEFGIEFVEIPRLENQNEVISASRVRKALSVKDWETIKMIVPETTYRYLKEYF